MERGSKKKRQKRTHGASQTLHSKIQLSNGHGDPKSRCKKPGSSVLAKGTASRASTATARSNTSATAARSTHIVCAISENLAKETCVASLDASAPVHLQVTKQGNGQTYAETLAYLEVLNPHEILMNEGRSGSTLARKIAQIYQSEGVEKSTTVVKFISRACFDQTKGSELLVRVTREETYDSSICDEYILLSSAHAVLHYAQQSLGATFARKSLHLEVNSGGTSKMEIDRSTLLQLELLTNAKSGKTRCSLISTIDFTKTSVGSRLLRTNLMSPPARLDTITSRLDLVQAFLESEDFFYTVLNHLKGLPCLDKMLANVALVPQNKGHKKNGSATKGLEATKKIARKGISALVGIKTILSALPAFVRDLEDGLGELDNQQLGGRISNISDDASTVKTSLLLGLGGGGPASKATCLQQHHLLRAIILAMKSPALALVLEAVSQAFTDSTTSANRSAHAMRHEECFALEVESTSMMSAIRRSFLANVDKIYGLADEYAAQHGFFISVRYSSSRGYHLAVPEGTQLPPVFIHPSKSGHYITCTTEKVHSLNILAQDNYHDLLVMTLSRIQEVLDVARLHYDALALLSDAIALLDLCHSNADCVTQRGPRPWCRPVLTGGLYEPNNQDPDEGDTSMAALVIRNGRYVIDVSNSAASGDSYQEFVANDTYAADAKPFTVVTGINGSGKSTYLKQIAIIVILAHCGSYVPADQAIIPVRDRLCTRIGKTDDPEHNISTFMSEMKETAFICRNATSKSLLLIDELGRATSNVDGVALAWAVSEHLLQTNALTFFATHYSQVTLLGHKEMYSSVQNQHMEATIAAGRGGGISYSHKVSYGPCRVGRSYGVELAGSCGWPEEVLQDARTNESNLQEIAGEEQLVAIESDNTLEARQSVESMVSHLKSLLGANRPKDLLALRRELHNVRRTFDRVFISDRSARSSGECTCDENIVRGHPRHHQTENNLDNLEPGHQGVNGIHHHTSLGDKFSSASSSSHEDDEGSISSAGTSTLSSSSSSSSSSGGAGHGDHGP